MHKKPQVQTAYANSQPKKEALESVCIPNPPLSKQQEIANNITNIRQQAQQLKAQTQDLLQKANQEIEQILLG